ncbi:MAG: thiol protease/hemagglutinin PrtT [Bacteroidales bacterium]|jgi:hypothetical protein|nr:thiol protease/hemagglutinin PrtT [Bacteroidales bacterium]MDD2687464.1 thiol protease/hemagglutinin PrtT [Bacteroidales bacterium]MDD3331115.1 thiol protease/hemagglutinin PrtT [Bacteroidales bacterium]MDD4045217.1 thiol protease/hemagglutinin PrtT [Bacteroidales bacterium]MDD4582334.1 thiol protease/hemagglutinin PrtT [Bacteroidales bacterium]
MKKLCIFFLLIAVTIQPIWADPISIQTARQVAESFLAKSLTASGILKQQKQVIALNLVYTSEGIPAASNQGLAQTTAETTSAYYIFSSESQGYVIVSGDDRFLPILGYSEQGNFDPTNIPNNMQKWLEGIKTEIRYAIAKQIPTTDETKAAWHALQSGVTMFSTASTTAVSPLISSKWNQAPYYNESCPYDNSAGEKTVTGCVATAMAMVMKFWNYPATGSGFHSYSHSKYGTLSANFGSTSYDWTNMPNQLSSSSSSTQKNAVATLMYHCGVSVDMNYGISSNGGSGAYVITSASPVTHCTEYALKTYFGYKNTLQGLQKANYTQTNWINLLKTELDAGRPIIYAGFGDGGHCFVCDGYDNNNYFHFNWGWGGAYDGYFALNALNPGGGGIGGGSYSYNDGQQAVIGITPPSGGSNPQDFDLRLYSSIYMSSTNIWFANPISLTVDIANYSTTAFNGQFGAALFDSKGDFVDFLEIKSSMTLNANSHYTNGLTFSHSGTVAFVPGTYYVAIFYKTSTQDWTIIDDGDYYNLKQFEIYYTSDIEVNSDFTIKTNGGKLIQGQSTTVNVDVLNTESYTFYGKFRVNLAHLDGSWAQNIEVVTESDGLPYNYHYNGGIDFSGVISVEPGTYLMEVAYQSSGSSSWYYAGSSDYSNPIYVIVEAASIQADIYENNNSQSQSYTLSVSFSSAYANKTTNGSNLHVGTDIDYYKINLPQGYDYTISPRIHDAYNSSNGKTYTVDALFSYSKDGVSYSESYDDEISGNVFMRNGGTFYVKVAPYFSGSTGTYLLDLNISRSATSIDDPTGIDELILLYPNPAEDFVIIDLNDITEPISHIDLTDIQGKVIYSQQNIAYGDIIRIDLDKIAPGIYVVQIHTLQGILNKKLYVR